MRKIVCLSLLAGIIMCILVACDTNTSKAYTFTVDNGDKIKIELNTTDGYDLSSDLPFTISCDGETLTQGSFVLAESYEQYVDVVNADEKAELIDTGTYNGNQYTSWCYNGSEYNYIVLVKNSNTAIVLGNLVSKESAKECFNRLVITVEK